jgi:formylglycine-generating enzyme required for sulfatase activity
MRVRLLAAFALALAPVLVLSAQQAERVSLDGLLNRAGWYLESFIDEFENVVAEEIYTQDASVLLPSFAPTGRGAAAAIQSSSAMLDTVRARHRDLRSDFLLAKSADTQALMPFRDVLEVDGLPVRDREARLAKLFLGAPRDVMEQAAKIGDEGARYNLGNMRSTLGNPVLGLGVLQKGYQSRFQFSLGKEDRSIAPGVWIVSFKEVARPAMIRGEAGRDLFSHGRVWIDAMNGRVLKTEILVEQPALRAVVTTLFRVDEHSGIAVPTEMREQYTFGNGNRVNTVATYGRFRRFDVSANEELSSPLGIVTDEWTAMTLVEIPAGRFTMGSAASEVGRNDDEALHDVEVTHAFFLGRNEVTQQEWKMVMGSAPSHFSSCGTKCPVENVNFFEIQQFLAKLNNRSKTRHYRLPTEAEWEYACRARTTGPFSTGENLTTAEANYNGAQPYGAFAAGEFRQKTTPAGAFPLNPWGLADMHGNVWEWTSDWYGPYAESRTGNIDPRGPAAGEKRVIRGGSWFFDANSARCGLRYTHAPADRGFSLGFRVAADRLP